MHIDGLIRMANDIGAFFASEPEPAQAANSVLTHIKRYWDPRMRTQIVNYYRDGGRGFAPHVDAAIAQLAADWPTTERQA
jgi:formate dehydrogenase subunit delta